MRAERIDVRDVRPVADHLEVDVVVRAGGGEWLATAAVYLGPRGPRVVFPWVGSSSGVGLDDELDGQVVDALDRYFRALDHAQTFATFKTRRLGRLPGSPYGTVREEVW